MTISLETRRDQSALLLFHKIHCGAVFIEKAKHMTLPGHHIVLSIVETRHTYSEKSIFSQTVPHWNSLSPSVANTQTQRS